MQTGSTVLRVAPNPAGGWEVREPGSTRALRHAAEKDKAVLRARGAMLAGGVVQVFDRAGLLTETYAIPSPRDRPWWYVPPRPLSWVMGVAFLLQGVFAVTGHGVGTPLFWLGLVTSVMGVVYLVLVSCSWRRDRRLIEAVRPAAGHVGPGVSSSDTPDR